VDQLSVSDESRLTLLEDGIAPAARTVAEALEHRHDSYTFAMQALVAVLEIEVGRTPVIEGGATR
jgi:hypothetical protein